MSDLPMILLGKFFGTAQRQIKLIGHVFCLALVVIATGLWGATSQAAPNDFNNDGRSDIVLQQTDGSLYMMLMSGSTAISGTYLTTGSDWSIRHAADFNGDGRADIVLQRSDGSLYLLLMSGTSVISGAYLTNGNTWSIKQVADFNDDGRADIVLQHTDGSLCLLLMNGTSVTSAAYLTNGNTWSIRQSADFNGDRKADIVLEHTDGSLYLLLMNGTSVTGGAYLTSGNTWSIRQSADFNSDGRADIVLQHTDGSLYLLLMNGTTVTGGAYLITGSGWVVRQVGDFNGDGRADIVIQHADGRIYIYLMNGVTPASAGTLAGPGSNWLVSNTNLAVMLPASTPDLKWSQASSWGGALPQAGDAVTIPAGRRILLDVSPPALKSLLIEGELVFDWNHDLNLTADWIIVSGSGARLTIGTDSTPYLRRATITLSGTNPTENIMGMGTKVLGTNGGGAISMFGQDKRSWTRLGKTAPRGVTRIELADPAAGWKVGDEIAIAPSDFDTKEAEKRSIVAINGQTVILDRALDFDHWGESPQPYGDKRLDMRAEVANLSRNIVVRSADNADRLLPGFDPNSFDAQGRQNGDRKRMEVGRFGGHMMFMAGSAVRLQNIEVTELGQQGMLGRYPVHWHLTKDSSAGSFIRNSSIHDTFQRGLVLHQANGVRAENNVIFNTPGHAVFMEDGVERNNVLAGNLVMRVTYVQRKHRLSLRDNDDPALDRAERQAGFWLTNPQNTVRGNVVAGVQNGWGFILADVRTDKIPVVDRTTAEFAINSYLLEFKDNVAHTINFESAPADGGAGVFNLGYGPEEAGSCFRFDQRGVLNAQAATVSGITAYKCRNAAFWSTNFKPVRDTIVADSRAAIVNNQGEREETQLSDSVVVARTANNPASRTTLEFGPFPGPELFEFLEAGPVRFDNVLAVGTFSDNDNSTPALSAPAPVGAEGYKLRMGGPTYLPANSSATLRVEVDRSGGYAGPVSLRVVIPKRGNLSADNPYFAVTSEALTIPANETGGTLTLRNGAHPKSGDGQITLVAEGNGVVVNTMRLYTSTMPITYANATTGNNVARLFADTGGPFNPSLSAMEFNRGGAAAVDGDMNTYAHTSGTPLAWWQIDLERLYTLKELRLRPLVSAPLGGAWVLLSDYPVFANEMSLAEALALPETLVRRFELLDSSGGTLSITLPAGSTGRVMRVWRKTTGEMKLPEVEIVSQ